MRTTLNVPDELMEDLIKTTGSVTKTRAVSQALASFLQRERMRRLKELAGKLHLRSDWRSLEKHELKEQRHSLRPH